MQAEEPFEALEAAPSAFRSARVPLLVVVFAVGLMLFLAVEPTKPWILLVVTGIVALGADGIMREHPLAARETDVAWTAPLLFLPTLLALGAGLFLEDALTGYWVLPGVLVAALILAGVLYAQHTSIDTQGALYPAARFVLNLGTYLAGFAFYAVVYTFDVSLVPAALTVGLISVLLGVVIAEARWALYFLPLESYLAGVFLLLAFYVSSGLVQHHLNGDLRRPVIGEFVAISSLGVLIVALGRIFEAGT